MNDTMTTAPPPTLPTATAASANPVAAASSETTPTPAQTLEAVTPLLPARLAAQFAGLLQVLPAPSALIVSQVIHHVLASHPSESGSKKRSLPDDDCVSSTTSPVSSASAPKRPKLAPQPTPLAALPMADILVAIPDLSVSSPVRKKLTLLLTRDALYLAPSRTDPPVFHLPFAQFAQAVLVDAPEKTKRQPVLLVFGKETASASVYGVLEPVTVAVAVPEAVVAAVPEEMRAGGVGSEYSFAAIVTHLTSHPLASPATDGSAPFTSAKRSPMGRRTNHPYLSCYHKGKDGHLWLLADGLVYGLKKPFLWIPHARIAAIKMVANGRNKVDVHVHTTAGADRLVVKFDMIDTDEAAGVGAYVGKVKGEFAKAEARAGQGKGKGKAGDDDMAARANVPFLAMDLDDDDEDGSAPEDGDEEIGSGSEESDDSDCNDDGSDRDGDESGAATVATSPRVTRSGRVFVGGSASPSSSKSDEDQDQYQDEEMDELESDV